MRAGPPNARREAYHHEWGGCAALIDSDLLDHYHRLEREHIHLRLLEEAGRGITDVAAGKTVSLKTLKTRYGR